MSITLEEAKDLDYGMVLHHDTLLNADKTPLRVCVTGMVKTWKRDPSRVRVPIKHGLYDYGCITNGTNEGNQFTLDISEVSFPD